ncbi:unnamed protein product, partial [Closterium sp. Naga37s-1]
LATWVHTRQQWRAGGGAGGRAQLEQRQRGGVPGGERGEGAGGGRADDAGVSGAEQEGRATAKNAISLGTTYEQLLSTNRPFPKPVPLPVSPFPSASSAILPPRLASPFCVSHVLAVLPPSTHHHLSVSTLLCDLFSLSLVPRPSLSLVKGDEVRRSWCDAGWDGSGPCLPLSPSEPVSTCISRCPHLTSPAQLIKPFLHYLVFSVAPSPHL